MADGRSRKESRGGRAVRRTLALWFRGFLSGKPKAATPTPNEAEVAANDAAADLVDQAQAFATLRVSDVMTPRADIVALDIATPLSEVVRLFVETEHTRVPIYRDTLDDPVGVVHIKDLFKLIAPTEAEPDRAPRSSWRDPVLHRLKRETLYVPASMRTADLLLKMRAERTHMAVVIDEFGGTDGLVTLEDLLEAVVGEIDDEHDEEATAGLQEGPGGLLEADGRTPLEALEARLGAPLLPEDIEEEVDTVGGLVAALTGRVPQRGELIVHPAGHEFEVIEADPRRVRRIRIRPAASAGDKTGDSPVAEDTAATPSA